MCFLHFFPKVPKGAEIISTFVEMKKMSFWD